MSAIIPLQQIKAMADEMPVTGLKGKITKVWKFRKGEGQYGPWSFQDIVLTDGTTELTVTLKDREQLAESWRGHQVHILAKHGEKGWTGLKTKIDQYQGKPQFKVLCTKSAELVQSQQVSEQPAPAQAPAPAAPAQPLPPSQMAEPPDDPGTPPPLAPAETTRWERKPNPEATPGQAMRDAQVDSYRKARALAGKILNAHKICFDEAVAWATWAQQKHGVTIPMAEVCAHATSAFIKMDRLGLVEELPTGPVEERTHPAALD